MDSTQLSQEREATRRDEIAAEKLLLEHEQQERQNADTLTPIPAMRNNTDWSGWTGPF
jgi:hypothetical protein